MNDTSGTEEWSIDRHFIYMRKKNSGDDDNDDGRGAFLHHHLIKQ
jgi:hypothetical protein